MPVESVYYDLLGVKPEATLQEIKQGYRKMAMKYHPDKNTSAEAVSKFQEISHAYEVLTNPEKKSIYDKYGAEGLKEQTDFDSVSPMEIFAEFLKEGGFFFGGGGDQRTDKPEDIIITVSVDLEELYTGTAKTVEWKRQAFCPTCNGRGTKKKNAAIQCKKCKGSGVTTTQKRAGFMVQQYQVECSTCKGDGKFIRPKDACTKCKGDKSVEESITKEVKIDAGMVDRQVKILKKEGHRIQGLKYGDVLVVVNQKKHDVFTRVEDDLCMVQEITLLEALTGYEFVVKHLGSHYLRIKSKEKEITKPGDVKVVNNEGMPKTQNPSLKGDLLIKFDVKFPLVSELSSDYEKMLCTVLPKPVPKETPKSNQICDVRANELLDAKKVKFFDPKFRRTEQEGDNSDSEEYVEYGDYFDGGSEDDITFDPRQEQCAQQ
eukprot:TRINITY_DN6580_c0_g3_i1.p1 TRINITY_DN6580_c0_g3~~TRINITY_DN6580_c0_g3_i1.p1  ORF type:complete len:431 (-),score=80.38 TRINITY_DN6580_c0_g3_i1:10-1302(-)